MRGILMTRHRTVDAQMDELGTDPGQVGPDSAGQSGDAQGLSEVADAADESVEDLADTGQPYEAEVIEGVEDAADHPERPVPSHSTREERIRRSDWSAGVSARFHAVQTPD
jgi:hypothetical protein